MTPILRRFVGISCLALGGLLAAACARAREGPTEAIHVDSGTATFTEINPGVTRAVLWGDPDTGPHAAFVKFAAGQQNPLHTHTNDIRAVVLSGAYLYRPENGQEQRIAAGHFLFLPGGDRHFSGGDATEGALFYYESPGRFDLNPVQ